FWAGIPVLWDDRSADELFDLILIEAADHSHVFELPRGNHPNATDATRRAWQALNQVFLENLYADSERAVGEMKGAIGRLGQGLPRAETYLHSVLGVDR